MAVVNVREIWSGRSGSLDEYGNRDYVRVWRVLTDNITAGPLEITSSGALPAIGSSYITANGEQDLGASLRGYHCVEEEEAYTWTVSGSYSSRATQTRSEYNPFDFGNFGGGNTTGQAQELDPLLRAAEINIGTLRYQKALVRDSNGLHPTASNGQIFDPPIMVDRAYLVISISKNKVLTYPVVQTALDFQNKINSTSWALGTPISINVAPELAKCESITATTQIEQKKMFWRVNYLFHINVDKAFDGNDEKWDLIVLNAGTYKKPQPGQTKCELIKSKEGGFVNGAYPLDANGVPLVPDVSGNLAFTYRTFKPYKTANFNTLGLP